MLNLRSVFQYEKARYRLASPVKASDSIVTVIWPEIRLQFRMYAGLTQLGFVRVNSTRVRQDHPGIAQKPYEHYPVRP